jgi:acetyl-CoA hydrolase
MDWRNHIISAQAAAQKIKSGYRVFLTGNCSTPQQFIAALRERAAELQHVELVQILSLGKPLNIDPSMAQHLRVNSLFIDKHIRQSVNDGYADFTPVFLSQIPFLFRTGRLVLDAAIIHISPPDEHGFCSYGIEVGVTKSAAESAGIVIAEVNPNMPRTHGDSFIHVSQINYFIEVDYSLPEVKPEAPSEVKQRIAKHIAELIPDGATLQTGIGGIPDAVLRQLGGHKNLGIHTELFSDGVMEMIEAGVITNASKSLHPGKVVAGFGLGTEKLFQYVHDNPFFEMHPTEYVNDPYIISKNDRMISINSAIEVDLTGQVCADSIGYEFYSGVGGQLDFVRGATRSKEGKSFIALPSTSKGDTVSRITGELKAGAGVTTSRNDVMYVVTEYGAADLFGRSIRERVHALANVAHPNFREDLLRFAREHYNIDRVFAGV